MNGFKSSGNGLHFRVALNNLGTLLLALLVGEGLLHIRLLSRVDCITVLQRCTDLANFTR